MNSRIWAWLTFRGAPGVEVARILLPLAILVLLALWLAGTVTSDLHTIARSL